MPAVIRGNTTGSIAIIAGPDTPGKIISYILTNNTGGTITISVKVMSQGTNDGASIGPTQLTANEIHESKIPIIIDATDVIVIVTSGSLDYYFSFEGIP